MTAGLKARPVLMCLHKICSKYNKLYCFPSQKKLLDLLWNYQGEKKSIATLNRWLRVMEDARYIRRTRRIRKDPRLGMVFKSTLYVITVKGYQLLARGGLAISGIIARITGSLKKKSKKISNDPVGPVRDGGFTHIKDIVGGLKKCPGIAEQLGSSK